MGAQRSLLFYGEYSGDRVQIPVTCWLVKTTDGTILFDTGLSPRAVPGLMRNDPLARFTEEDLLVHRLDTLGLQAADVDLVVISHLHYDHAGGAGFFVKSELVVQQDEYSYAHHPAAFFAPFYYPQHFDLPDARSRLSFALRSARLRSPACDSSPSCRSGRSSASRASSAASRSSPSSWLSCRTFASAP